LLKSGLFETDCPDKPCNDSGQAVQLTVKTGCAMTVKTGRAMTVKTDCAMTVKTGCAMTVR